MPAAARLVASLVLVHASAAPSKIPAPNSPPMPVHPVAVFLLRCLVLCRGGLFSRTAAPLRRLANALLVRVGAGVGVSLRC